MATTDQFRLLPFRDDDRFEQFCLDLWSIIWNDTSAARNGRSGQAQCGVDVYGILSGSNKHHGIQAKAVAKPLTNADIQHEIDEAKKFIPPLEKLTIATTAPRDGNGQEYVRNVDLAHIRDSLFRVEILGWEDIQELIQNHLATNRPDLIETYFEVTVSSSVIGRIFEEKFAEGLAKVNAGAGLLNAQTDLPTDLSLSREYHDELDYAKRLVNNLQPKQALVYLQDCRNRLWGQASADIKFRLLHYTGMAQLQLSETVAGGSAFVEALQYKPEDEIGLTFAALGYLLLGDQDAAGRLSRQATAKNPASPKAHAIQIAVAGDNVPIEQLAAGLPPALLANAEVAHALGQQARRRGDLIEAERWIRTAVDADTENWSEFKGSLGEILLARATNDMTSPAVFQLTPARRTLLNEAADIFTAAWDRLDGTEVQVSHWQWLANRSLIRVLLEDRFAAAADLDLLRELHRDKVIFTYRRAQIAAEVGDFGLVRRLVQDAPKSKDASDLLIRCQLLLQLGDAALVLEHLRSVLDSDTDSKSLLDARLLALEAAIDVADVSLAETLYLQVLECDPDSPMSLITGYRVARLAGDEEKATQLLRRAAEAQGDAPAPVLAGIAYELFEAGEPEKAAALYERIADARANNPITRLLLRCYYDSGVLGKALDLANSLISVHGALPMVSDIAAAIYEEAGDLAEARKTVQRYLQVYPDDESMKLRLAVISLRASDIAGVDAFLATLRDTANMRCADAAKVAKLYALRGRLLEALAIAYEVRRRFPDESDAHLLLIGIVLTAKPAAEPNPLLPDRVGIDTAVQIGSSGDPSEWIIIEQREDFRAPQEQPPSSPLAVKLMGLAVGDTIEFGEAPVTETVVIQAILSKYVYALHESMRVFQRRFPDSGAIRRIKVGPDPHNPGLHDIKQLFDLIDGRDAHRDEVETLYRSGQIPIGTAAKLLGDDIVSTWARFMSDPALGIRCTAGSQAQLVDAQKLMIAKPNLVLEPISLLTIHGLDVRDEVAAGFGPFAVAQSLIDWLNHQLLDLEEKPTDGYMVVGKENNTYVRQEVTPDDVKRQVDFIEGLLSWVSQHCEVQPIQTALERSRSYRTGLESVMQAVFVDSMLLAAEEGRALYSDDAVLRGLCAHETGAQGVWTQALLAAATDIGVITAHQYAEASISLSKSNYRHTHVNAEIVLTAAMKSDWKPAPPFTNVVDVLSGAMSEQAGAIAVAADVIYGIWKEHLMDYQKAFLLEEIIRSLIKGRNAAVVVSQLRVALRARFRLHPLGLRQVSNYLSIWCGQHLI